MDALILAGGENKRIPLIKGFLEIRNRKIIETNIELLKSIFSRVILSVNHPELYFYLGLPMIGDVIDSRGPMTGILSVFMNTESADIFVTACDMPYINAILIKYMVEKYNGRFDALIPLYDGKPQPLFGIYAKRISELMEQRIRSGKKSLLDFLKTINVRYINEEEVRSIDPEGRSFVNINTFKDYQREGGAICLG
ncbi:MAG: molybdenum cofactor guanylyltransferase [Thermodesulfovibrionales bacterium]